MRGVKGSGPEQEVDAKPIKMVTLHQTIMWPGVPTASDGTLTGAKVKGLKMYLVDEGKFLHMTCGALWIDIPISGIKAFVLAESRGLND